MSLPEGFQGYVWRTAHGYWYDKLPLEDYINKPIKYLEIGTLVGANLLSVENSYASHPDSELHCIDPWLNYDGYTEYLGEQQNINYDNFLHNIDLIGERKTKIKIHRGFSHVEVPKLEDEYFDMIYIDANHLSEYVMEDAVLCFRKLKVGGILIFDDYEYPPTSLGANSFLSIYRDKFTTIYGNDQLFLKKIKNM